MAARGWSYCLAFTYKDVDSCSCLDSVCKRFCLIIGGEGTVEGFFREFVFSGIKISFIPLKYSLRLHCNAKWTLLAKDILGDLNNLDNVTKFSFASEEEDNLLCKFLHSKFDLFDF
jgi:hypothetical protein